MKIIGLSKGPKLRYKIGFFVRMLDDLKEYEVIQAYRLKDSPSNWIYRLCKRDGNCQHEYAHTVWMDPVPYPPPEQHNTSRIVRNQDMIRLAEILIDDVMES